MPLDQEWKHACYEQCLAPVLDAISKPTLDYDTVLDLDKRIRDFSLPASLRNRDVNSPPIAMQRASLSTALEAGTPHFLIVITCIIQPLRSSHPTAASSIIHPRAKWPRGVIQSEAQVCTLGGGRLPQRHPDRKCRGDIPKGATTDSADTGVLVECIFRCGESLFDRFASRGTGCSQCMRHRATVWSSYADYIRLPAGRPLPARVAGPIHVSVTRGAAGARTSPSSLPLRQRQMTAGLTSHSAFSNNHRE